MNQITQTGQTDQLLMFFKASADALRLDILRVLRVESFGVMELCHVFNIAQSAMSHHLKILSTASLVSTRREGNSIFYRRALIPSTEPESGLLRALFIAIDSVPISFEISERAIEVHRDRELSSKAFFDKNAGRLKENQDLIAEFSHYAGCLQDLLNNESLSKDTSVVEVGPGESPLLATLLEAFTRVTAIDSSEEMLAKAKQNLGKKANSATFTKGELSDLDNEVADLIVVNMVLHHIASPAGFFKAAFDKLNAKGRLFILDLCPHSQDWTRDVCGDLWLGFESADLESWATEARFSVGQSAYLGLKNGFQVQLKMFHKP
ncbi:MAG: DNA-binding transcriptional ArsR family regulator [Candidatus Azotimanducaceae bacterium]|jgi:DNA-binding transcriptional ArsR family regulator